MDVLEAIHSRRSVRAFTTHEVTDETIELLIRAAMAAPTAGDRQTWRFVVVRDQATRERLASPAGKAPAAAAPVDIVVLADPSARGLDHPTWAFDCALAVGNLMLAAVSEGLGTVWLAGWPNEEWAANIRAAVDCPDALVPICVVAVGVPVEQPQPHQDRYRPDWVWREKYAPGSA